MKEKLNLFSTLGFVAIVFTILSFLFPIGTGIVWTVPNVTIVYNCGYDYVFGNDASQIISNGYYICVFALLIIAVVFQILGTVFTLPNPDGNHKFSGFLHFVAALCLIVVALFFFLGTVLTPTPNETYVASLGYGFIIAGIYSLFSAVASSAACYISYKKK